VILMIDNYDSFTYNLVQMLMTAGAEVEVVRNDAASVEALLARAPEGIVLSPGPGRPEGSGAGRGCRCSASASAIRRSGWPSGPPSTAPRG
jgi:anthranilate/para-aminobenzoate synthase component II